jgi:hypothetical protein
VIESSFLRPICCPTFVSNFNQRKVLYFGGAHNFLSLFQDSKTSFIARFGREAPQCLVPPKMDIILLDKDQFFQGAPDKKILLNAN